MPVNLAILALAGTLAITVADRMPNLNIEKTCRNAVQAADGPSGRYEGCLRDERAARDQLAKIWDQAKPSVRASCGDVDAGGLAGSYVDVLTCVQMYKP